LENTGINIFIIYSRYDHYPSNLDTLTKSWIGLLNFAYLAQCRCDPAGTLGYFTALLHIFQAVEEMNEDLVDLLGLILRELGRNRFTHDDFLKAVTVLGFGHNNTLGTCFDETVGEEFIVDAWRNGVRKSLEDETYDPATRQDLNNSLRVIAEVRGSVKMHDVWEQEVGGILIKETTRFNPIAEYWWSLLLDPP
jgi:ubiquitin carboxyl-terminal hydrolase 25/28